MIDGKEDWFEEWMRRVMRKLIVDAFIENGDEMLLPLILEENQK